jgi:hypothetical protein
VRRVSDAKRVLAKPAVSAELTRAGSTDDAQTEYAYQQTSDQEQDIKYVRVAGQDIDKPDNGCRYAGHNSKGAYGLGTLRRWGGRSSNRCFLTVSHRTSFRASNGLHGACDTLVDTLSAVEYCLAERCQANTGSPESGLGRGIARYPVLARPADKGAPAPQWLNSPCPRLY